MSSGFIGMNVEEVRALSRQLHDQAEQIRQMIGTLDGAIHHATWVGHDADMFKNDWWPKHKGHLNQVAQDLEGFSTSAKNNAQAQDDVSRV